MNLFHNDMFSMNYFNATAASLTLACYQGPGHGAGADSRSFRIAPHLQVPSMFVSATHFFRWLARHHCMRQ